MAEGLCKCVICLKEYPNSVKLFYHFYILYFIIYLECDLKCLILIMQKIFEMLVFYIYKNKQLQEMVNRRFINN